jgi:hypothetical protein
LGGRTLSKAMRFVSGFPCQPKSKKIAEFSSDFG